MKPYFLKFTDEAQAIEMLSEFRNDGQWITDSLTHRLNDVGVIRKPTGNMIQCEFGDYPEMAPLAGYHINLLIDELPKSLLPFSIEPKNPTRIFPC